MVYFLSILLAFSAAADGAESSQFRHYLVQYKSSIDIHQNFTAAQTKRALIRNTQFQETLVFSNSHVFIESTLWIVNGSLVHMTPHEAIRISKSPYVKAVLKMGRRAFLTESNRPYLRSLEKIRIPEANSEFEELTGASVTIGIIDTGIDSRHPSFKGKSILFKDFIRPGTTLPYDDHGHGTHVAGTASSVRTLNQWFGVAPQSSLLIAKVFSKYGGSSDLNLLKSLQWMADPDENPNTNDHPQVVSNSWNLDDSDFSQKDPADEPFCQAIEVLNSLSMTVIFSSGNDGPGLGTVKTPGSCPEALTVGATDFNDRIAEFSSRGPVQWKSQSFLKPEVVAPGKDIVSANPGGGFKSRSGTSMAAPHVAGLAALLYQARPHSTSQEIRNALMLGSDDFGAPGPDHIFGSGRINSLSSILLINKEE